LELGIGTLYLTKEEDNILNGERGEAPAIAMKLLVSIGEIFNATRLIPVESSQVSGISYKTVGDAGLEFIESLAKSNAKAAVLTTMNPAGMDLENWRTMGVPEGFASRQLRIVQALKRIGVLPSCTCTPYLLSNPPKRGAHLAWAESSAVIYANSIIGAKTNREGGPMALASAIVGKTPQYGFHLEENRLPTIEVNVTAEIKDELDFSLLGYQIGKRLPEETPLIHLHSGEPSLVSLKALGASMATSGGQALYHIKRNGRKKIRMKNRLERVSISRFDLDQVKEALNKEVRPEVVCIGCPHCSLEEMEKISRLSNKKRFTKKVLIFTSRHVWNLAKTKGYLENISSAGGTVIRDTCMVVAPLEDMGITRVLTNSAKAAHYLPSLCRASVGIRNLSGCLDYATNGE
jgi:hypothetical protein